VLGRTEFEAQLSELRRELVPYCRHLLWAKRELEDAVQEVVFQALRSQPRFSGGDLKRWLFRVATNTVYNLNRKHRDRPVESVDRPQEISMQIGLEETYEEILRDPSRVPENLDGALRSGLESLNDSERAVMLLRSICEFKYHEIADVLSIPIGTVMGTLARARAKIREHLAERLNAVR
jgi:RNA polymerase sigma-70 factor (ECF subfamily)